MGYTGTKINRCRNCGYRIFSVRNHRGEPIWRSEAIGGGYKSHCGDGWVLHRPIAEGSVMVWEIDEQACNN
jgi:hypothetical protein